MPASPSHDEVPGLGSRSSRRDEIMLAASRLFAEQGFEATTTQDIADQVGMLKGSLYYHIKSKEEVLYEILEETHELFAGNLDAVARMYGTSLERIWGFIYRNVQANATHIIRSTIFFKEFRLISLGRREHIVEMRDAHDQMLRELIEVGRRDRVIRKDVDAKLTALAALTMCNALYQWYKPGGPWTADDLARDYADFVVAGLGHHGSAMEINGDDIVERLEAIRPAAASTT